LSQRNNSGTRSLLTPLRWSLAPLAGLYWAATSLRNHLYDIGYSRSLSFEPLIISVGNLSVGGTGKSPMIECLVRMLRKDYPLAVLSRGYRRKTQGIRIASEADNAETLGDEPYQFYRKFTRETEGHRVVVAVGEERALAIPEILHHHPEVKIILLDDAFQHRAVKPDLQILLTTYQRPFYQDHVLPLGLLRESRKGAQRADVVVVTKCPKHLEENEQRNIAEKVQAYSGKNVVVFFSSIDYQQPEAVFGTDGLQEPLLLFSGLANADSFDEYVRQQFSVKEHIRWGDHHRYTDSDKKKLQKVMEAKAIKSLLTTEKDMVKLVGEEEAKLWKELPLFYLPIRLAFLSQQNSFQQYISESIRSIEKA